MGMEICGNEKKKKKNLKPSNQEFSSFGDLQWPSLAKIVVSWQIWSLEMEIIWRSDFDVNNKCS